jgi:hypothetical protein
VAGLTAAELRSGIRRFAVLSVVVMAATAIGAAVLGALAGSPVRRSVSVGFYAIGAGCLLLGLFQAVRPPVRVEAKGGKELEHPVPTGVLLGGPAAGAGPARWATPEEVSESYATAGLLLTLGFAMIAIGTVIDGRRALV